eukprot:TRINITY_DN63765_c0_g1_i1.p1 TRINITY_DN63765_c0_g1~~TRINITY_DN63765_c0_g1_i1.p1  ORF type:complete len:396 (+),score=64.99 TRINITY_DN63765_c0_g1_i1:54-1241(+)
MGLPAVADEETRTAEAHGVSPCEVPGVLLDLPFREATLLIVEELRGAASEAADYTLQAACVATPELLARYEAIIDGTCPQKDTTWKGVSCMRISETWKSRREEIVWLDDKFAQVHTVRDILNEQVHLPLLAYADDGDAEGLAALRCAVQRFVAENEPITIKPRHGANSKLVFLWPNPREAGEAAVLASVNAALESHDPSWTKENWQLGRVPRGVVVQPLYMTDSPLATNSCFAGGLLENHHGLLLARPLELSVLVVFGVVVASVLNMHPLEVWVTREGAIQQWRPEDLKAFGVPGSNKYAKPSKLPEAVVDALQNALRSHWPFIRSTSERIVRGAGLDELRVDWLLGDQRWGPRIGELTYMGAGSRFSQAELSEEITLLFARGHIRQAASHRDTT